MASVPFNNLITFSRGSNATVTGPTGLVQWAPNNQITHSEQIDNAAWTKGNITVVANVAAAPDGTSTADRLVPSSVNTIKFANGSPSFSTGAGQGATHSCYVKADGYSKIALRESATTGAYASFDLATASVIETGNAGGMVVSNASVTDVGNGWYRLAMTCANPASTGVHGFGAWPLSPSYTTGQPASLNWTGNGTSGLFIWGAQLELGSAATTYNSTTVKNLLGFSEAFDNAAWTKSNASIVTGAQANPVNGAFNAQKLMEDTVATVPHGFASANVTTIVGTPMASAFYAKAAGRSWVVANAFNAANKRCWFDLANGTAGTTAAGCTTSITSVGNGWYRCAVIQTAAATTMSLGLYASTADGVLSYTGDGNSGVYIYGAQLSDSASLDPYVPTPAAAPSSTAYYGPRFDYDPVTLAPKGLLVEEARTNLQTYSEDFTNAIWTKTGATITANVATPPSGVANADKLVEDTSTGTHNVFNAGAGAAGAHTFSVWAKAAGRNWIVLRLEGVDTYFDLGNGILGSVGVGITATIRTFDNAWFRCTVTKTMAGTAAATFRLATSDGVSSYTGDGVSGVFLWGAQLEAGAFATSYIPTVASTVTRAADVATISGSLFSQWYNNTEGTLLANFVPTNSIASNTRGATITDGTNRVTDIYIDVSVWRSFNGTTNVTPAGSTAVLNSTVNFASAYKSGDYAASMNGGAVGTAATAGVQSANKLTIGTNITNSAGFLNGHIRSVNFIPARAADFQLQALTT